jgi:hypothetical protein
VQQAFISQVAPGAIAAQHRYGVPAAVTIAQAIDESAWGQSSLATKDHNLFGIKGTGPAGSDTLPTQEYGNGQSVTSTASFRIYHNIAESINDHGSLLATSGYYARAMADRQDPNAFAAALTGTSSKRRSSRCAAVSACVVTGAARANHASNESILFGHRSHMRAGSANGMPINYVVCVRK